MRVSCVLALTLALLVCTPTASAPLPGFGGLPDLGNLGQGFGAKIGNIIKGNTYDGLERALRKISAPGRDQARRSSESDGSGDASDGDEESSMFGFSGKQFEQLVEMLQNSQPGAPKQPAAPLAAIDNSVD